GEMGLREPSLIYDDCVYGADNTRLERGPDLEPVIAQRQAADAASKARRAEETAEVERQGKAAEAERKAAEARVNLIFIAAMQSGGSAAQKEMRKRGLMSDAAAVAAGRRLMEDAAFWGCPLPAWTPPDETAIDYSDWRDEHPEDDLPDVKRDKHDITADDSIAPAVMEAIMASEAALRV